jgi:plasmid stabilization system protein ParE
MKVRFTRPALDDLSRIHAYISKDNPVAAARVVTRLIDRALELRTLLTKGAKSTSPTVASSSFRVSAILYFTSSRATKFISRTFVTRRGGDLGISIEGVGRHPSQSPPRLYIGAIPSTTERR